MAQVLVSLCALSLLSSAMCFSGGLVSPFLGDSVELSAGAEDCDTSLSLIHREADDRPLSVAERVHGAWTPGEKYRDRIESRSASSVLLKDVNYNDGGIYEFMCRGALIKSIQLQAVILSNNNPSVSEGDALRLPCYCQTVGRSVESVRWERNGTTVLELDVSSGAVRYGSGFEGRASLSSNWSSLGDLSMTVEGARPEDRGDYCCSVSTGGRNERGTPAAVRATIRRTGSTAPPTHDTREVSGGPQDTREVSGGPRDTQEFCEASGPSWLIITAVLVCVVTVVFVAGWILRPRCCVPASGPGGPQVDPPAEVNGIRAYTDEESPV